MSNEAQFNLLPNDVAQTTENIEPQKTPQGGQTSALSESDPETVYMNLALQESGTDSASPDEVASVKERVLRTAAINESVLGMPPAEALLDAIKSFEKGLASKGMKAGRNAILVKQSVKSVSQKLWSKGTKEITVDDVRLELKTEHGIEYRGANGIGDAMGRGHGSGLFMEFETLSGSKSYKIPNPKTFPDWYEGDVDMGLPAAYYTPSFLKQLIAMETPKTGTKFFDRFEVANLAHRARIASAEQGT